MSTIYVRVWHRIEFYRVRDKSKCCTIDNSVAATFGYAVSNMNGHEAFVCAKPDHLLRLKWNVQIIVVRCDDLLWSTQSMLSHYVSIRSEYPGCIETGGKNFNKFFQTVAKWCVSINGIFFMNHDL